MSWLKIKYALLKSGTKIVINEPIESLFGADGNKVSLMALNADEHLIVSIEEPYRPRQIHIPISNIDRIVGDLEVHLDKKLRDCLKSDENCYFSRIDTNVVVYDSKE